MIEHSEKFDELPKALLLVQKAITKVIKNADNPFTKKKYADLEATIEAIKPPLNTNNICFMQYTVADDDDNVLLETLLLHNSGESMAMRMPIAIAKNKDPQAFGSGLTYAKRYSLQALLGLPTADDDGQEAVKTKMPEPTEEEMEVINAVWKKLTDSAPEGMEVSKKKITKFIFGMAGGHISELDRASGIVAFILGTAEKSTKNQIKSLCIKKKG